MLFLSLQLLAASAATLPIDHSQLVRPEVAVERVKACGFKYVSVKNDDTLQEDVIVVSGVRRASDFQLRCVVQQSLASSIYVQFPGSLDGRYQRLYFRMRREADRIEARTWLQRRGLLAKLPNYERGKTDDVRFTHELEDLCGPKAKGAFVQHGQFVTMNLGTVEHPALDDETMWCLVEAASAANFPLGFVGNEYYQRTDKNPSRE